MPQRHLCARPEQGVSACVRCLRARVRAHAPLTCAAADEIRTLACAALANLALDDANQACCSAAAVGRRRRVGYRLRRTCGPQIGVPEVASRGWAMASMCVFVRALMCVSVG